MKIKPKITIARAVEGISLNGKEFLLDERGNCKKFKDRESAKQFLKDHGHRDWTDEEIEDSYFFEEEI